MPGRRDDVDHRQGDDAERQAARRAREAQGDIPQMAIASGNTDPFECLLLDIGIDPTEFTDNAGPGRVHFYRSNGLDTMPPAPGANVLFSDPKLLARYEMIILPCEGTSIVRSPQQLHDMLAWTNAGGRLFLDHFNYSWIASGPDPLPRIATWKPNNSVPSPEPFHTLIDLGFPRGHELAVWLKAVGASSVAGKLDVRGVRNDFVSLNGSLARRWIHGDDNADDTKGLDLMFTFDTPIVDGTADLAGVDADGGTAPRCGRVVYSDFHGTTDQLLGGSFPTDCRLHDLSNQELAVAYMLFELSACDDGN
jgi:hypothetical protein